LKSGRELIRGTLGLLFWQVAESGPWLGRIRLLASRD